MDVEASYIIIALAGLLAFFIKGITGTGTTTIIIAICAFIIEVKMTIVLASLMNIIGGIYMLRINPVPLKHSYYIPIAIMMIIGSIIGATLLKLIEPEIFSVILGCAFIAISSTFFLSKKKTDLGAKQAPDKATPLDMLFGWIGGVCGGFIGVNAPPLVYHFGKALNKSQLRRLLIIIFVPAAITQTLTFSVNGLLDFKTFTYALAMLPGMIIGIYLGNKTHLKISETWFRRILGIFVLLISAKLLLG